MSFCMNRMNENMKEALERDIVDCEQKRLVGYLKRNKKHNQLPSLVSRCCCRHLESEGNHHNDVFNGSTSGINCGTSKVLLANLLRAQSILANGERSLGVNCGTSTTSVSGKVPDKQVRTSGSTGRVTNVCSDTGRRLHSTKPRKDRKHGRDFRMNSRMFENRAVGIVLTTSVHVKNEKYDIGGRKTRFRESLPSLVPKEEGRTSHSHRSIQKNYVNSKPGKLVCYSNKVTNGRDDRVRDDQLDTAKQSSLFRNYQAVTPQDLMDFNIVHFSRSL